VASIQGNTDFLDDFELKVNLSFEEHRFSLNDFKRVDIGKTVFPIDKSLYRSHCSIIRDDSIVYLVALQTPSRVFINGVQLPAKRKIILQEADQIILGQTSLDFSILKNKEDKSLQNEIDLSESSSKLEVEENQKGKKEVIKVSGDPLHASLRIFSLFLDLALAFSLKNYFSGMEGFSRLNEFLVKSLVPSFLNDFESFIRASFSTLIILFGMKLITSLLIGRSLNQLLLGVRASGSRLSSFVRELLAIPMFFVQFPLWPSLFSKRMLNEVIAKNYLVAPRVSRMMSGLILSIVATTVFFVYLPFFIQYESNSVEFTSIKLNQTNKPNLKKDLSLKFSSSEGLNISFINKSGLFKEELKSFDWGRLISQAKLKNPLFLIQLPVVHRYFARKKAFNTVYRDEISKEEIRDLRSFFKEVLSISPDKLVVNLVKKMDFFPASKAYLQSALLEEFEGSIDKAYFIESDQSIFIAAQKGNGTRLIPVKPGEVKVYTFGGISNLNSISSMISLIDGSNKKGLKGDYDLLKTYRFLNSSDQIEINELRKECEKLYGYFYKRGRSLKEEDKFIFYEDINAIASFFESNLKNLKIERREIISQFLQEFLLIEKAVKFNQEEFFSVNQ